MTNNYSIIFDAVDSTRDLLEANGSETPDLPEATGELLNPESGQQKLDGVKFAYDVLDSDPSVWI